MQGKNSDSRGSYEFGESVLSLSQIGMPTHFLKTTSLLHSSNFIARKKSNFPTSYIIIFYKNIYFISELLSLNI